MVVEINPYLITNGNGKEAIKFYEDALDANVLGVQTFGENPAQSDSFSADVKDRVLHAQLKIGKSDLMISDTFPDQPFQVGNQLSIAIMINGSEKTRTIFEKLANGGKVEMSLQETFWSPLYGQVQDRFGVLWQVSTIEEK
ncbi:VOC family protein [Ornithinibacillus xuwenensis]|uniref:VOC family protein n=1 Tax=Ornithinibacillus xuwenensis TaxID=3144668 RepID=A0ABU9XFP0_9BACI